VRLSRVLEAEGLAQDLILDGPYPDRARAAAQGPDLIQDILSRMRPESGDGHPAA
jgi:hypothetical protein